MSGTKAGGRKAAETNRKRHGADFYARIGAVGGELVERSVDVEKVQHQK